ncbi:hypothetical protein [Protaetiibacter larvae]|uniref:hypothetical protein n=1 Tax=Protaetiibacter larvae TaxID=2592654 RepID=UPI00143DBD0E|nr:hypothetical protein [Protaetiibacter larvae]
MNPTPGKLRGVVPWIVLWLSAPLGGLIAFWIFGPVTSAIVGLAAGAVVGLGVGAAQAWALRRPLLRWTIASAIGLGIGTDVAIIVAKSLPDSPAATLLAAAVAGLALGAAQLFAHPPTGRLLWLAITTLGWVIAWGVSLTLAISTEQGFVIFGSTGSLVLTVLLAVALWLRRRAAARAIAETQATP